MNEATRQHAVKVKRIQAQARSFYKAGQKVKIYHAGSNSTRAFDVDPDKVIDVSGLRHVLKVDTKQQYALVEPNVPMDELVAESLKFGLLPPVVMEFPGITVGGGIQGGAGESSSFRHGLFNDICLEYEIVLGDGSRVVASPQKNADLFHGIAASYGSLGVITSVKLGLIPAHRYVRVRYKRVNSFTQAVATIEAQTKTTADFIDSIMFAKDQGVVMTGSFADTGDLPITRFHHPWDEWFYLHAKAVSTKKDIYEELVPLTDYLFRYDRGAFWTGRFGFTTLGIPFNRVTRFLISGLLKTRTLYKFMHASHMSQQYLVQDVALPTEVTAKFMEFVDRQLSIYPLWLCPLKPALREKLSGNYLGVKNIISVGVYGEVSHDYEEFVAQNRLFERKAQQLGGRKWLYAHSYYSREEFWRIYDKGYYDRLRRKYQADVIFPNLFDKIVVTQRYQPSIRAGFKGLIKSPFRLKD